MNSDENITTAEFNPTGEQGKEVIKLAKKAIESVRNNISSKNTAFVCKKCGKKHPTFHSCGGFERSVKSKELTKKVLELFCGNMSTRETTRKCESSNMNHRSLYPGSVASKQKTATPAATANRFEEKGQAGAKPTELHGFSTRTATCQCCGNADFPGIYLYKIDSGQLLCPDCLKSLRKASSRIPI